MGYPNQQGGGRGGGGGGGGGFQGNQQWVSAVNVAFVLIVI
jgi:hypothetical protein